MASLEQFVCKIKPAMDRYLRAASKESLENLHQELTKCDWVHMKIFNVQILAPLVLKLEELEETQEEIRRGTMECIRLVLSKIYLNDVQGLRTILVVVFRQIHYLDNGPKKQNISEEIKLAATDCITEAFRRSTTDVLERFYVKESSHLIGQILVTLVKFIGNEKFKKLVFSSIECLMAIFYVHDGADPTDVVLRNQVADTLFIFLPKIVTVLSKTCLSDEKYGASLKSKSIKALGSILFVVYDQTNEGIVKADYAVYDFRNLITGLTNSEHEDHPNDDNFGRKQTIEEMEILQKSGRTPQWFRASSRKLRSVFMKINMLRSHRADEVRTEYAHMCCVLLKHCGMHLKDNFVLLLENVVAMSEDEDSHIRQLCQGVLQQLQKNCSNEQIFDESAEIIFDEHIVRLSSIIYRSNESEQYSALTFWKGFLRNLSPKRMQAVFSISKNLEMFCLCLILAANLTTNRYLLIDDQCLRELSKENFVECSKRNWRQFKYLNSSRCVEIIGDICFILGTVRRLNDIIMDYLQQLLVQRNESMNEIIMIMSWIACPRNGEIKSEKLNLVISFLNEILDDKHWHLTLEPDEVRRIKVNKPTTWFLERTPGLYESAVEIRMQDCDSDDETNSDESELATRRADVQFNVLHTCIVLDALADIASFLGSSFDKYLFRSLHKVLLKIASSNSAVYSAAYFTLITMQKALKFAETSHFIDAYTDYISFHLNTTLKKSPEIKSALNILTVVLQLGTRNVLTHLDNIMQTIHQECSTSYQSVNVPSYLRLFKSFLTHVCRWQKFCDKDVNCVQMQIDLTDSNPLHYWVEILNRLPANIEDKNSNRESVCRDDITDEGIETHSKHSTTLKLPHHVNMANEILNQTLKFLSTADKVYQILSLDCLITGVPLLRDYENELLPLVHLIWQPLVEKFRQRDAVVLNRSFELLTILAVYSKDFLLKRSLDDIVPFLKKFLKEASVHSSIEKIAVQTQEYKLQLKLLKEFANLITSMEIDGKHLNEISEVVALYLSREQPLELQKQAVNFFNMIKYYNRPLMYLTLVRISHLRDFKENTDTLLTNFK